MALRAYITENRGRNNAQYIDTLKRLRCRDIYTEENPSDKERPAWREMLQQLKDRDAVIVEKLSIALHGIRELSVFFQLCRLKHIRLISPGDRLDTTGEYYPVLTSEGWMELIATFPMETRKNTPPQETTQRNMLVSRSTHSSRKREAMVVNMYKANYPLKEILRKTGYARYSYLYKVLEKYGISCNRRPHFNHPKSKNPRPEDQL